MCLFIRQNCSNLPAIGKIQTVVVHFTHVGYSSCSRKETAVRCNKGKHKPKHATLEASQNKKLETATNKKKRPIRDNNIIIVTISFIFDIAANILIECLAALTLIAPILHSHFGWVAEPPKSLLIPMLLAQRQQQRDTIAVSVIHVNYGCGHSRRRC